jgi:hypothetical protein
MPQTTITRRMLVATETHSEYVIVLLFHCHSWLREAPQCYVICTLPVFGTVFTARYELNTYEMQVDVSLYRDTGCN